MIYEILTAPYLNETMYHRVASQCITVYIDFFLMVRRPYWLYSSSVRYHDHTQDTRQSVGLLWMNDRPTQRPDSTQYSQETGIHAPGGIRTLIPSKGAATDPRLRQRYHWDRSL
jgi:hypothetical protein